MHGILALGRQRQKGYFKFEVSLDDKVRPCPVTKKEKQANSNKELKDMGHCLKK